MTLSQFITLLNKTKWDVTDFNSPDQCFDLIVGWCDNIKIPRVFPHLYAYQIYTVWSGEKTKYFDRIENTPEAMPQAGDIIVWKLSYNGTAGHTAVATGKGDLDSFEAFSQNDPTDSPCVVKTYTYDHVHGWLRPKHIPLEPDTTWPQRDKWEALIGSFTSFNDQGRTNYYSDDPSRLTADIIDREETIEDLRKELREKEQEFTLQQKELSKNLEQLQKELDKERNTVIEAQKELSETKDYLSTIEQRVLECQRQVEDMATNTEKDEEILTLRGDIVQLQAENEMIRKVSFYGLIDWVKSLKLK